MSRLDWDERSQLFSDNQELLRRLEVATKIHVHEATRLSIENEEKYVREKQRMVLLRSEYGA